MFDNNSTDDPKNGIHEYLSEISRQLKKFRNGKLIAISVYEREGDRFSVRTEIVDLSK